MDWTPLKNMMKVSWDDDSNPRLTGKCQKWQPNHQLATHLPRSSSKAPPEENWPALTSFPSIFQCVGEAVRMAMNWGSGRLRWHLKPKVASLTPIKLAAWEMLILSGKTPKENHLWNADFFLARLEYQQIFQRTNNGLNRWPNSVLLRDRTFSQTILIQALLQQLHGKACQKHPKIGLELSRSAFILFQEDW